MATTSTTNAPLPWQEPYLRDYASRAQDQANKPYQQGPGSYTGPNGLLMGGWQAAANRAQQGSPVMGAATGQMMRTIGGAGMDRKATMNPYADVTNASAGEANPYETMDNPFLTDSINNAQGDLTRSYNQVNVPQWAKTMQNSGSFGNSGVSEYASMDANNLQRNLGRIGTDMRGAAYNRASQLAESRIGRQFQSGETTRQNRFNAGQQFAGSQDAITGQERGYQQAAMGMAPSFANQDYTDIRELLNVGREAQGFDQQQQDQEQKWFQEQQQFPRDQLGDYGQSLGLGTKGGTSTQTSPDPSRASQMVGGGLTGLALYNMLMGGGGGGTPSDARLKKNIKVIGRSNRGYTLYSWDWKSGGSSLGVIAQEVALVDPSAVSAGADGYLMVDYSKVWA